MIPSPNVHSLFFQILIPTFLRSEHYITVYLLHRIAIENNNKEKNNILMFMCSSFGKINDDKDRNRLSEPPVAEYVLKFRVFIF